MSEYISVTEATELLGVARGTMHYYLRTLKIQTHKFPLDRHKYLTNEDFETIKRFKAQAQRGQKEAGTIANEPDKLAA
jgi:hypothetical protein